MRYHSEHPERKDKKFPMKILIATPEATPYVKTGGLADVTGALLKEYTRMNLQPTLVLPLYRQIREQFTLADTGHRVTVPMGNRTVSGRILSHGPSAYFLECDKFFDRTDLYGTPAGDYPDNAARFTFFSRAALEACIALRLEPDVIHCNDWQTGLMPLYLRTLYRNDLFSRTASLMTIHNLGYQGLFDVSHLPLTGLPAEWFNPEGIEFYGKINFLKAGLIAADIITTVSKTYAKEILTPEYGHGLDGFLRKRESVIHGIINGIDTDEWDPLKDTFIPLPYGATDLSGKKVCKNDLMKECSLSTHKRDIPLLSFIGRLSAQKGLDIFIEAADDIMAAGVHVIILGKGDKEIQDNILSLARKHRGRIFVKIGYDEAFAHRVYAGSDLFVMPSRYEPCGLGQLIAMRYGTIPVARRTGGLEDTIADYGPLRSSGTGFLFDEYRASSLKDCLERALCAYMDTQRWRKIISSAMAQDFSWQRSAKEYITLYADTTKKVRIL
jgi:starch synthase